MHDINRFILKLSGLITLGLASLVLLGWIFSIVPLIQLFPTLAAMNPVTAVLFLLCGIIVICTSLKQFKIASFIQILSLLIISIASFRVAEIWFGSTFHIDLVLFSEKINLLTTVQTRMALATAVNFVLFGAGIFVLSFKKEKATIFAQLLFLVGLILSAVTLVFFTLNALILLESPIFFNMALHTALLFFMLFLALFVYLSASFPKNSLKPNLRITSILLLISLPLWVFVIAPDLDKISSSFFYEARVKSVDNLYDQNAKKFSGELISNSTLKYRVIKNNNSLLDILNTFEVKKNNGEVIFSVDRTYAIDSKSGAHDPNGGDISRTGYLFAPKNLNKQNFTYWHVNYNTPIEMSFVKETIAYGLPVFEYTASFQTDQTAELSNLPEVGTTKGINLDVQLTIQVDPKTGYLISYHDQAQAWFYDLASKVRLEPWNMFYNVVTASSVKNNVLIVRQQHWQKELTTVIIPVFIVVLAVTLFGISWLKLKKPELFATLTPAFVLLTGLILSTIAFIFSKQNIETLARLKFEDDTEVIEQQIVKRLEIYANTLQGAVGLFNASNSVSRDEWKTYVDVLEIQRNYPGIQGVGFAVEILPENLASFEKTVRAEGFPNFSVSPQGERELYTSILFLEPFDARNKKAFGFDMFQEPTRNKAMKLSKEKNEPVISGKVTLVQEITSDIQAGFLMYLPVYDVNINASGSAGSHEFKGYVYSPFRMNDFMNGALQGIDYKIDVEVFDGSLNDELVLDHNLEMYDHDGGLYSRNPGYKQRFQKTKTIDIFGHHWTLRFISLPQYGLDTLQERSPYIILGFGIIVSLLLSQTVFSLTTARRKALELANTMTEDLRLKSKKIEEANRSLSAEIETRKKIEKQIIKKSDELERTNELMVGRELRMKELKKQLAEKK